MKRAAIVFLILALAGGLTYAAHHHNPEVVFQVGSWVMETHAVDALAALGASVLALYIVIRVLLAIWYFPRKTAQRRAEKRRNEGLKSAFSALDLLAGERINAAESAAAKTRTFLEENPLSLAISGMVAKERGDRKKANGFFTSLNIKESRSGLAVRSLIEDLLADKDRNSALAMTDKAIKEDESNPWLWETRFTLHAALGQWEAAQKDLDWLSRLGKKDEKRKALTLVMVGREKMAANRIDDAQHLFKIALKSDPVCVQAHLSLGEALERLGKKEKAAEQWRIGAEKTLSPALFHSLSGYYADNPLKLVTFLEVLHKSNPNHPGVTAAMIAACLDAKMWGRARELLKSDACRTPAPEHLLLAAKLELVENGPEAQADPAKRAASVLNAIQKLLDDRAAAPSHCRVCGADADAWSPICPACDAWGAL